MRLRSAHLCGPRSAFISDASALRDRTLVLLLLTCLLVAGASSTDVTPAAQSAPAPQRVVTPPITWAFTTDYGRVTYDGWCGNHGMWVNFELQTGPGGLQWFGLAGEQSILVQPKFVGSPVVCSYDGEWLAYRDPDGYRDRDTTHAALRRLHLKTRHDEQFAVVGDPRPMNFFAPSAHRVFVGRRPDTQISMPAPRWDVQSAPPLDVRWGSLWEDPDYPMWFPDSSAVWWTTVGAQGQWREFVVIQRFDRDGGIARFRSPIRYWSAAISLRPNEVTLSGGQTRIVDDLFYRCVPVHPQLKCVPHDIQPLAGMDGRLLPDGSVISVNPKATGTYRTLRQGARYTVRIELRSPKYRSVTLGAVSPDGRRIMVRGWNEGRPGLSPHEIAVGYVKLDAMR